MQPNPGVYRRRSDGLAVNNEDLLPLYAGSAHSTLFSMSSSAGHKSPYRLDVLRPIQAFQRLARKHMSFERGQLVYYGPQPSYYGIGEVKHVGHAHVAVDFRGTGVFDVHQEVFEPQYLIPIPDSTLERL